MLATFVPSAVHLFATLLLMTNDVLAVENKMTMYWNKSYGQSEWD